MTTIKRLLKRSLPVGLHRGTTTLQTTSTPCAGAIAAFWHCALNDCHLACAKEGVTWFDFENISYWGATRFPPGSGGTDGSPLKLLMQILSKTVRLLTPPPSNLSRRNLPGFSTTTDTPQDWDKLWEDLDQWHIELPVSFVPYARYDQSAHIGAFRDDSDLPFSEVLFSRPVAAATMQLYHFARILLLLCKPSEHLSLSSRLRDRRHAAKTIENHCKEICGIAAGRPSPEVRIHAVQSLFLAGQCLERVQERQGVVRLLQDIESDLGWPTEDLVERLQLEWKGD
jgi:hypothetical protein